MILLASKRELAENLTMITDRQKEFLTKVSDLCKEYEASIESNFSGSDASWVEVKFFAPEASVEWVDFHHRCCDIQTPDGNTIEVSFA
jgi:hypothetical protein